MIEGVDKDALIMQLQDKYNKRVELNSHPDVLRIFFLENPIYQYGKALPNQITSESITVGVNDIGIPHAFSYTGYKRRTVSDRELVGYLAILVDILATERALDSVFERPSTNLDIASMVCQAIDAMECHNKKLKSS